MFNGKSHIIALKNYWKSRPFLDPRIFIMFAIIGTLGFYAHTQYDIHIALLVFGCFCVGFFVEVEVAKFYCRKNNIQYKN
jgi:hypothetical protein